MCFKESPPCPGVEEEGEKIKQSVTTPQSPPSQGGDKGEVKKAHG